MFFKGHNKLLNTVDTFQQKLGGIKSQLNDLQKLYEKIEQTLTVENIKETENNNSIKDFCIFVENSYLKHEVRKYTEHFIYNIFTKNFLKFNLLEQCKYVHIFISMSYFYLILQHSFIF